MKRGETLYVEFTASVGRLQISQISPSQIGGGDLIAVREASESVRHWEQVNVVARPGDTLEVSVRLHNTGFAQVIAPSLQVHITPPSGTYARLTATIVPLTGIAVSSRPLTINYSGAERLTLEYLSGSTELFRCRDETCKTFTKGRLPDGVVQGGIQVLPALKRLAFVNFRLLVLKD
jgi:hypothetical protein